MTRCHRDKFVWPQLPTPPPSSFLLQGKRNTSVLFADLLISGWMSKQSAFWFNVSLKDTLAHGPTPSCAYGNKTKKDCRALQAAINQMWHRQRKLFGIVFRCNLKCGQSFLRGDCKTLEALVHVSMTTSICNGEVSLSPQKEIRKQAEFQSFIWQLPVTSDLFVENRLQRSEKKDKSTV